MLDVSVPNVRCARIKLSDCATAGAGEPHEGETLAGGYCNITGEAMAEVANASVMLAVAEIEAVELAAVETELMETK